jgi:hypothetical protein
MINLGDNGLFVVVEMSGDGEGRIDGGVYYHRERDGVFDLQTKMQANSTEHLLLQLLKF